MNFSEITSAHGPKSWNHTAEKNASAEALLGIRSISYSYTDLLNPIKLLKILRNTHVFHFYAGYTLIPISTNHFKLYALLGGLDIKILKLFGKKVVMHFQGCELRDRFNPLANVVCETCQKREVYCKENRAKGRRNRMIKNSKNADALAVTTPDLKAYLYPLTSTWIPKIALKNTNRSIAEIPENGKLRIIHAPSNRSIKGSSKIIEVLNKHKDKFELVLLENVSREEVYKQAKQSHIAIDQIRIGWYGNFAVEMMSLGLPVICHISETNMPEKKDGFPIINASSQNLEEVLISIYNNRSLARQKAGFNQTYLEEYHSEQAIANKLKSIYQTIY
jgi:hypothetical protein